jgi:Uma2 family endonuclease
VALPRSRLFSVDEYYRMAEAGILSEDERVELIEGQILKLGRTSPWHASRTDRLVRLLILRLRDAT